MAAMDWSDGENDLIVADYFSMLRRDLAQAGYNKAAHNRDLRARIARTRGAIEFKHQNISAVLMAMGEAWITGYKPAWNYQDTLEAAVNRWLTAHPDWSMWRPEAEHGLAEAQGYTPRPAPTLRNTPPTEAEDKAMATARKFDIAGRDERNRKLGLAGEVLAFRQEQAILRQQGRPDLAEQVVHTSQALGDGAGYDISSFDADGHPRLIEVKTTNGYARTPFHISRNECAVAEDNRDSWVLLRLYNFRRSPEAFEIRPPLSRHVDLTLTSFLAHLR